MNWKEAYNKVLKSICEDDVSNYESLVDMDEPKFSEKLEKNENAKSNSLYSYKLNKDATEKDYKDFCEYIYSYIGKDINNYLKQEDFDSDNDFENWEN